MVLFEAGELAAGSDALSRNTLLDSAYRSQVEALSKAVAEVLFVFGVEQASCGQDSVREFVATTRDLTAVVNSQGVLDAAIVFGFDTGVAHAVAGKVLAFMFDEPEALPTGEEDEFVRRALGEVVSFTLLATLKTLGLPPEVAAPRFVRGTGVRLLREPQAVRRFSVRTESGEFEVGFAPGVSLSQGARPPWETALGAGRAAARSA